MKKVILVLIIIAIVTVGVLGIKNLIGKSIDSSNMNYANFNKIKLSVLIPCGGHASLIINELSKIRGIENIEYKPITTFIVYYDSNKTSEQDILSLDIFKTYPAKRIN